jgi:hypothetical protein
LHRGTVIFLVLVAALLLSTHYWPEYVNTHGFGYLIEVPKQVVQVAISVVLLCASICVILAPAFGPKRQTLGLWHGGHHHWLLVQVKFQAEKAQTSCPANCLKWDS